MLLSATHGQAKSPFFERCAETALNETQQPLLVIGDFNTGRNDLDVEGSGTRVDCVDQFIGLSERAGLADLWRFRNGERREWTWRSAKNGFRIDHAFGNEAFINRFPNYRCEIDHEPRLVGLTDHSADRSRLRIINCVTERLGFRQRFLDLRPRNNLSNGSTLALTCMGRPKRRPLCLKY
jgi:hypothetical protein